MKINYIGIYSTSSDPAELLINSADLSQFSFYQKGSVLEFMKFFSGTVISRTKPGMRESVQENNYTFHAYNRGGAEGLGGELIMTS